jgi:TonB-dependent SusC/RagA subfamily outer membrane receptor
MTRTAHHLARRRAVAAVLLVPLLGCASRGPKRASPPPEVATGDRASVGHLTGQTLDNLFTARFPGVTVARAEGGGLQIRIRGGNNSFYGNSEPLYVVDDMPLGHETGGIVFLNPADIEEIVVLKNPADIAYYGVRGGNGVIKITTTRPDRQ